MLRENVLFEQEAGPAVSLAEENEGLCGASNCLTSLPFISIRKVKMASFKPFYSLALCVMWPRSLLMATQKEIRRHSISLCCRLENSIRN